MVNSISSAAILAGGDTAYRIPRPRNGGTDSTFQLDAETTDPVGSSGPLRRCGDVRSRPGMARQLFATVRQETVPVVLSATSTAQVSSASVDRTSEPASKVSTKAADPGLTGDAAIVQSLKDALAAAGINVQGLNLTAHTSTETYPGGSYVNRYISVDTPSGSTGLMTDLVAIDPKIAVQDIKRMLGAAQAA